MNITQWIVLSTIAVLLAYDVVGPQNHQPTESMVIRNWGWQFSAFAFTAGLLVGHWFFPRQSRWVYGWMYALPLMLGLFAWDLWWHFAQRGREWYRFPGIWFVLGVPVGMYLWNQVSKESPLP